MKNNKECINISNNKTIIFPSVSYENAAIQKLDILKDNIKKTGIYRWTNVLSKKSYIGSAINLSHRFKNYYNISYLEKEIQKNKSMIYRALLKYGYHKFKLDILEFCIPSILVEREQYYLDKFKPEYNILKVAGSLKGYKHSKTSIELIRATKLGRKRTDSAKLIIAESSKQAQGVIVINNNTGVSTEFTSIRKAAKFINIHYSYVAKCIKINNIYKGKLYTIFKKT